MISRRLTDDQIIAAMRGAVERMGGARVEGELRYLKDFGDALKAGEPEAMAHIRRIRILLDEFEREAKARRPVVRRRAR